MAETVVFFGEQFRTYDAEDCEWAFLEFAEAAGSTDANALAGMAAVMGLLRAVIHEDDWARFRVTAQKHRARVERDLMPLIRDLFERETGRPTGRPSDSSGGSPETVGSSGGGSSSQVIDRLLEAGRPSLALIVSQAQEYKASA